MLFRGIDLGSKGLWSHFTVVKLSSSLSVGSLGVSKDPPTPFSVIQEGGNIKLTLQLEEREAVTLV